MEPIADGFRNYCRVGTRIPAETLWSTGAIADATAPEMTALVGGMRVLAQMRWLKHAVFTRRPER